MREVWIYTILSVIIVSLISLIGIFTLSISTKKLDKALQYLISFAAGSLFGDALIHLLPEIVEEQGFGVNISIYIILGIVISFIIEKVVRWRHCHHPLSQDHPHPFAIMNLFGDSVHNLIDGMIIGASYMVSIPVGIATTVAIVLHEIPQEIGDFAILIHGGFSRSKALFLNFITGLLSILGAIIALVLSSYVENLTTFLIPFAAGGFIYIAGSDIIPEMQKELHAKKSALQSFSFILGIVVMLLMLFVKIG